MTTSDVQFRNSFAAQKQMTELAFSLVTMRANTPAGKWVDDSFGSSYQEVWARARSLAGDEAGEDMLMCVLNLADGLLRFLEGATGMEQQEWLSRMYKEYIEPIDASGTGVWSAPELDI